MPYFSVLGMLKYDDSLVGQLTSIRPFPLSISVCVQNIFRNLDRGWRVLRMFYCLFHCFKVGLKQRKLSSLCIAILVLVLLLIQSQTPDGPLKTKSLENMKTIGGRRRGGRRLSEDTDEEEDLRRNAKQATIRMLKQFAKGFF